MQYFNNKNFKKLNQVGSNFNNTLKNRLSVQAKYFDKKHDRHQSKNLLD